MASQVFISFKNTDNGQPTADKALGEQLYKALMKKGVDVFFSNKSLLDFGEAAYKDAIDVALDECRIVIVIGTRKEYLESPWVKYEWSTFQQDLLAGIKTGSIITYLDGIAVSDMPRAIRHFQSFDVQKNSVEEVADFVYKALSKYEPQKAEQTARLSYDNSKYASAYSSDSAGELERLRIQGRNLRQADMPAVNEAYEKLGEGKKKLYVLDIGCAYGFVGRDRFATWDSAFILGVDISENVVTKARELNSDSRFVYETLDLEAVDYKQKLRELMNKYNIPSFDLIFGAYLLQHLKDPVKLLRGIREFLDDDGYVIFRNSDDGSFIAEGDNGLIEKINEKYKNSPGASNRTLGRKLYYYLYTTGYRDIKTFGWFRNLSGCDFDERQLIFTERFGMRRMYFAKALESDPYNVSLKSDLGWMDYALEQLQELFGNQSFWYGETLICALAKKK